jgi:hypothetical protein
MSQEEGNDVDAAKKGKAVLKHGEVRDDQQDSAHGLPTLVGIVDDPNRRWSFTVKEVLNLCVQLLNIIAVLVFGVWAIRSYNAALQALSLAEAANALTMFQLCQSNVGELASVRLRLCHPIRLC